MKKLFTVIFLLVSGLVFANPPGTFQPLLLATDTTPATITYQTEIASATNAASYSFISQSIGIASSDRRVLVALASAGGGLLSGTSLTIGGVSASLAFRATNSSNSFIEFWIASVPTGTTADIVASLSGTANRAAIAIWSTTGIQSATPIDTGSSTSNPLTDTVAASTGGIVAAAAYTQAATSATWVGVTEKFDSTTNLEGDTFSGASDAFALADASLSVTATWGTSSVPEMAIVSFR
jgi:hypothetical protein